MQINNQQAGVINNIESLNGNFSIEGNIQLLNEDLSRTKEEIIKLISEIKELINLSGVEYSELEISSLELEEKFGSKERSGLQSSFNTYLKVFKKTVGTLDSGAEEIKKLLKLGASVGKYLALTSIM